VLALTVFSALAATANALYASYRVQRDQLIINTLESNRVYAAKLAESTGNFLKAAQQQLAYSARHLAAQVDAPDILATEVTRVQEQTDSFNSVGIVSRDGVILATTQNFRNFLGARVDSPGSRAALQARQPVISKPYVSMAGNMLINLSHPIYSNDGRYQGYIAGTIYLRNESALQQLLGKHHYEDGSYLFVVDSDGQLIYHADSTRVARTSCATRWWRRSPKATRARSASSTPKAWTCSQGMRPNRSAAGASSRSGPPRSRCSPYMA